MKLIGLSQGLSALVDDVDYDFLMQWKWTADGHYKTFYAYRRENGKKIYMHRQLCPGVRRVDHHNENGLDNQRENLRPATAS